MYIPDMQCGYRSEEKMLTMKNAALKPRRLYFSDVTISSIFLKHTMPVL